MKEVYLDSKRNSKIHAYINTTSNKGGLLVFAHSFKGEASEDNRFTNLANSLADSGINSIRMEFPGSINSFEDDKNYSIENCLDDDYDDELDMVSSQLSEYIYYSDTKK